jgi:hypothetical protein
MKRLTLTTIGTLAAVLAFSTGCSQSKRITELETHLEQEVIFSKETQQALAVAQNELASAEADFKTGLFKLANVQQQLAAKDNKISELKAQLSAALEHPPQ